MVIPAIMTKFFFYIPLQIATSLPQNGINELL